MSEFIDKKSKIVTLHSAKGGVGKSVYARNVGAYLSLVHKKKVLIIETVSYGNLNRMMGVFSDADVSGLNPVNQNELSISIETDEYGVSLLGWGRKIVLERGDEILDTLLKKFVPEFDVILIDTEPRLSLMTHKAIHVSDKIVMFHDDNLNALPRFMERLDLLMGDKNFDAGFGIHADKIVVVLNKNKELNSRRNFDERNLKTFQVRESKEFEKVSDHSQIAYVAKNNNDEVSNGIVVLSNYLFNVESEGQSKGFLGKVLGGGR